MATVNYIKCDVCGKEIQKDPRIIGFRNGFRFFLGTIFNYDKLDLCSECLMRLPQIKKNIELKDKVFEEVIDKAFEKYDDSNLQSVYLEGVQDTLDCFELYMLGKSKV